MGQCSSTIKNKNIKQDEINNKEEKETKITIESPKKQNEVSITLETTIGPQRNDTNRQSYIKSHLESQKKDKMEDKMMQLLNEYHEAIKSSIELSLKRHFYNVHEYPHAYPHTELGKESYYCEYCDKSSCANIDYCATCLMQHVIEPAMNDVFSL